MNRRGVLGGMLGAPFAAKAVAKQGIPGWDTNVGQAAMPSSPYPHSADAVGYGMSAANMPRTPLIDMQTALRMILTDADALAEMRSELYAQNRNVTVVDPDIEAMRSWSRMAKITFQRQRIVEDEIAGLQDGRYEGRRMLHAMRARINKLMWGE